MVDATLTYRVVGFSFTGFTPPIANLPVMTDNNAGRHLGEVQPQAPRSRRLRSGLSEVAADRLQHRRPDERATPTNSLTFTYDPLADQYNYTWNTDRVSSSACRQLIVLLRDGTEKRANFRLQ